jgi:hypothetical protein
MLAGEGMRAIYPRLFMAYVKSFNWGYRDNYPDLDLLQRSSLFSLYLLQFHGGVTRSQEFYEDAFLRALPVVLDELEDGPYRSAEDTLRSCYSLRTLERFAWFF